MSVLKSSRNERIDRMNLFQALYQHTQQLLFFKHTGQGLPEKFSPVVGALMVFCVLVASLRFSLYPPPEDSEITLVMVWLNYLLVFGLLRLFAGSATLTAYALVNVALMLVSLITMAILPVSNVLLTIWEFAAILNFILVRAKNNPPQ